MYAAREASTLAGYLRKLGCIDYSGSQEDDARLGELDRLWVGLSAAQREHVKVLLANRQRIALDELISRQRQEYG